MNIKYSRRLVTPYGVVLRDTDSDIYIEPSTRVPFIYDATKPLTVKMGSSKKFTGGEFDRMMSNFTADTRTISATPVGRVASPPSSSAVPPNPVLEIPMGDDMMKPCQPRPKCLDATPPCKPAVPKGGWCKEEEKPLGKRETITDDILGYGIGVLVGGGAGYYIAKKNNKSIIGGIVLGGAVGAGLAWTFLNRQYLIDKAKTLTKKKPEETTSSASGRYDKKKCKGNCDSKYKPISDYYKGLYYKMPLSYPPVPLANPKITLSDLNKAMSILGKSYDCCLAKCDNPRKDCSEEMPPAGNRVVCTDKDGDRYVTYGKCGNHPREYLS